jgi:hypothetical protein
VYDFWRGAQAGGGGLSGGWPVAGFTLGGGGAVEASSKYIEIAVMEQAGLR